MGIAYQRRLGCPDLGAPLPDGIALPIRGSTFELEECPAYYLRTIGMQLPAEHLVDGRHPVSIVSADVAELEAGAIRYSDLPPKRATLTQLYQQERDAAREHARKASPRG